MILEKIQLDYTALVLPKTIKGDKKVFNQILEKIKKLKKEPFGRLYVFILPPIMPELLKFLKQNDIFTKSLITDGKLLRLEF
jgi:hypothetical protein